MKRIYAPDNNINKYIKALFKFLGIGNAYPINLAFYANHFYKRIDIVFIKASENEESVGFEKGIAYGPYDFIVSIDADKPHLAYILDDKTGRIKKNRVSQKELHSLIHSINYSQRGTVNDIAVMLKEIKEA